MKIKYYLRGLGTGILFATIIMFISYSYRMSDSQIKKEAEKLGMVYASSEKKTTSGTNSNNESGNDGQTTASNGDNASSSTPSESVTFTEEATSSEEVTSQEESTLKEELTSHEESTSKEGETSQEPTTPSEELTSQEESTTPEETTSQEEATTPSEQETSSNQNIEKCELTVKADTASYDVAYALMVAGIIDNAEEFDDYLCYNGYAKRIQNGTYVITSDMTYEEIAELICRKYW